MKRATLILVALALLFGGVGQVNAGFIQLITNGGFETGNFNGWTVGSTQDSPFQASFNDGHNAQIVNSTSGQPAWFLRNQPAYYFGSGADATTPISNFTAFNGFDGSPGYFFLRQGFTLTGPSQAADLSFEYAIQSDYNGSQNRVFDVNILDASNNIVANVFDYVRPFGDNPSWSPATVAMDISSTLNSLSPGNFQLEFRETIPQYFTGPASFGIDNISLAFEPAIPPPVAAVPEPSSLTLLALGMAGLTCYRWRRRSRGQSALQHQRGC